MYTRRIKIYNNRETFYFKKNCSCSPKCGAGGILSENRLANISFCYHIHAHSLQIHWDIGKLQI